MILPEPLYISMEEAARRFCVSIGDLQWLAEEQQLPVYVRASTDPITYAKLTTPRWEYDRLASDLNFCMSAIIDSEGNPVAGDNNILYTPGFPFSLIFIKPDELRLLDRKLKESDYEEPQTLTTSEKSDYLAAVSDSEKPTSQTPEGLVAELRSKKERDEIIAVRLADKFSHLNGHDCMKALDPQKVKEWEDSPAKQGRPRQWFYYLKKKGEKILRDGKQ